VPLRNVHLHGYLKRQFGAVHRFDIESAGEAIRALNCAFGTPFLEAIQAGSYQIIRGRRHGGFPIGLEELNTFRLGSADLHIVPVAGGSKSARAGGTAKIIVGTALIGAAVFFSGGTLAAPVSGLLGALGMTYGQVAMLGLGVALAGAAQLHTQTEAPQTADTKKDNSHAFSGPINVNEQGTAIPLIYGGPILVGSQPISAGMDIENIGAYQS
jgi:predicted phage tail protein